MKTTNINHITRRPDQGCILISGPQAEIFLQGQLTCDVKHCPTLGGYCNTQGRLISLFDLIQSPLEEKPAYYLICPLDIVDSTIDTLKKYAVFSKVSIDNISQSIPIDDLNKNSKLEHWRTLDILAKKPQLTKTTQGLFLPHHLNLPELGGVSFTKGCYLGQEIIARMQYRSKIKKHLAVFTYTNNIDINNINLEPGTPIYNLKNLTEPVGHIVNISHTLILASLLDEHLNSELIVGSLNGPISLAAYEEIK